MSAPLSAAEQRELAELLAQDLVEFLTDPGSWQVPHLNVPAKPDALLRMALVIAARLVPLYAAKRGEALPPAELDAIAAAAALRSCARVRARFGSHTMWVDTPAAAARKRAEGIIWEAMQAGLPLAPAFQRAGVSRATGYRIRDRLLARQPR